LIDGYHLSGAEWASACKGLNDAVDRNATGCKRTLYLVRVSMKQVGQ
jgi:hypothetical protein